jgi:hypothetical protein
MLKLLTSLVLAATCLYFASSADRVRSGQSSIRAESACRHEKSASGVTKTWAPRHPSQSTGLPHHRQPGSQRKTWAGSVVAHQAILDLRKMVLWSLTTPSKIIPPRLGPGVLCRSSVGRSDLDVVAKFTKLFHEVFGTIDEELRFGFDALLNVADSFMKNLPDQAA